MTVGALRLDNQSATVNYNATINSGSAITLNGNNDYTSGLVQGIVLNSSGGGSLTVNCDIVTGSSQQWVTSRSLNVSGAIDLGSTTLSFNTAGANGIATLSGVISGAGSLNKAAGAGTLVLSNAANTFGGSVTLVGGNTQIASLANGGVNSSLGNASSAIVLNGATLTYNGVSDGATNRAIDMRAGAGINNNSSTGTIAFTAANVAQGGAASARTLTLGGSNTGDNTFASVLGDSGSGASTTSLTKNNAGTWVLTGANTYTGQTTINQGILRVTGAGVLGGVAGSSSNANNIVFGLNLDSGVLQFETAANLGAASQVRFQNTGGTVGGGGTLLYVGTTDQTVSKVINCDTSIGMRLESDSVGGRIRFNGGFSQTNRPLFLGGTGTGDNELAMVFGGSGGIQKRGVGTWLLSATNTYTGVTTLSGGELKVSTLANGGANSAIGASTNAADRLVFNGGALTYVGSGHSTNRAFTITSAPTINASGAGALTWNGASPTFTTGNTAYTITLGGTSTADNTWGTVLADNGSGATALTKAGAGKWVISGVNAYSGLTTVSAGTLAFSGNNALGSNLAGSAGSVVSFGSNTITIGTATVGNSNGTYSGKLDGTGTVRLRGGSDSVVNATTGAAGTSGNAFFLSVTTANMPTTAFALDTGASASDRKDFGYVNSTGDVLTLSSLSGFGSIRSDSGGSSSMRFITVNQAGDTTFNGAVTSHLSSGGVVRALTLEKTAAGSLTLAGFVGKETLGGSAGAAAVNLVANGGLLLVTNTFNSTTTNTDAINTSGTVTITSGTLGFAPQALINNAGSTGVAAIRMNGGVLRWHGTNTQDLTAGASSRLALVAGKTGTFDTNGNDVSLANALGGGSIAANLTKIGAGRLTLGGVNLYTGTTAVDAGTLVVNGSLANSALNVAAGATLMGTGTIAGQTTILGLHSPGNSPGIETFTDLAYGAGSSVEWELWGDTTTNSPLAYDQVVVSGSLAFTGATSLNLVFTGSAGPSSFSTVDWNDAFWDVNQEWLLYDVTGATTGSGDLTLVTTNWQDSTGAFFNTVRDGSSFALQNRSGDVYIVYAAVPEPGTLALAAIGLAAAGWAARRRRRRAA